jgi:transposase
MHIDISFTRSRGKVYRRVLLRTSYREGKKVKHKTIANLSQESDETIEAIKIALKNKEDINKLLTAVADTPKLIKGLSVGAIYVLLEAAKRLSITTSLGNTRDGKLALWQIFARIIAQGSRLSAVRLAAGQAIFDLLKLEAFTEDDLYDNLDWLSENQSVIEKKIFKAKQASSQKRLNLFLYDVTSSYSEGDQNGYGNFGYNRDKKRGKKQIVIGLLTDCEGDPISVQVFDGNTSDNTTVVEQVHKIHEQFGVSDIIFVGDRGMIKGPQIRALDESCKYITALTKPQMKVLIEKNVIRLEDFSAELKEVADEKTGLRYILRRNPVRMAEIAAQRKSKLQSFEKKILKENAYLKGHPKAKAETAAKKIRHYAAKLKIEKWAIVQQNDSFITLKVDNDRLSEEAKFDGCYIIKTNAADSSEASSSIIHARYKDLSTVEWAFRTMKTTQLEVRPHYVRKCSRTDGHVFIVMLVYKLIQYLRSAWQHIEMTVEEGISLLGGFHSLLRGGNPSCQYIPQPDVRTKELLMALDIHLPEVLPYKKVNVATRKKLVNERKSI